MSCYFHNVRAQYFFISGLQKKFVAHQQNEIIYYKWLSCSWRQMVQSKLKIIKAVVGNKITNLFLIQNLPQLFVRFSVEIIHEGSRSIGIPALPRTLSDDGNDLYLYCPKW